MNVTHNVQVQMNDGEVIEGYTVASHKKGHYSFMHKEGGLAHVPTGEVKEFKVGKKTSVMHFTRVEKEVEDVSGKKERKPRVKKSGEPSKMERAFELLKNEDLSNRKKCIEILIKELDMTKAGASTYHNKVKNTTK